MIHKHTLLKIIDNSGASQVRCIHVYRKGKNKQAAPVGSLVKASVQRLKRSIPRKKVKKSEVLHVLVVSTRSAVCRKTGLSVRDGNNFGIVINKELDNLVSNRVVLPMLLELRRTKFAKLLALAPRIL